MRRIRTTPRYPYRPWPGPSTTGVDPTLTLAAHSGNLSTSADHQVIKLLNSTGYVTINHKGVRITNCRFSGTPSSEYIDGRNGYGYIIEHCTFAGSGIDQCMVTEANRYIVRYNDVSGSLDGMKWWGSYARIEHNYYHDLWTGGVDPHNDCAQCLGGGAGAISHTRFYHNNFLGQDTSCVLMGTEFGGGYVHVKIWRNQFNKEGTGGGGVIYIAGDGSKIIDNHLGGADLYVGANPTNVSYGGNRDWITGAPFGPGP